MSHQPDRHRLVRLVNRRIIFSDEKEQSHFAATCGCGQEFQGETQFLARQQIAEHLELASRLAQGKRAVKA